MVASATLKMVAYWVPKAGTSVSEWEDGAAYNPRTGWFAVTDGASTGSSSREWAYTLAHALVADRDERVLDGPDSGLIDWLEKVRGRFDPKSPEFPVSRMPLWVQRVGGQIGSHATLLGGRIARDSIEALAVGDCCLFHLAHDARPAAFPLHDSSQFGTSPTLVTSHSGNNEQLCTTVRRYRASISPGDVLFAVSDALAEWLMRNLGNPDVWRCLAQIGHEGFDQLCDDLRADKQLKNDDVTLLRVSVLVDHGAAR